ncbi:MAG: methylmalonyl Co-A mutase-associated GTPase MeaB [Bacteroidetes bacterium]|nr:MAG: methylmalonyl Co-A mutase-associated GTPase MeaB [Bacteroidota bacterium]PIE88658.1 MAG: methylmalonyl Co-A mutase-associated GTPase MeaB [Bacteroidota bacterium]
MRYKRVRKAGPSVEVFVEGILSGNIMLLSKAITLIESSLPAHHAKAQAIIERCLPHTGNSFRVGITGVPGVGKSTFIEALGTQLTAKGQRIAVLAIDPSSARTKGSILGDKTRMEALATDTNAFIRPSPSAGTLGGVARKTHESIILCEAAGFDTILVETVGVGQSEIAVHSMVDFFLLLQLAGAGDELQGIKRGIMEMADAIVINKAEGDNLRRAELAQREYANALHLFPPTNSGWTPRVDICSSYTKFHIPEVWHMVCDYFDLTRENGFLVRKRKEQARHIMHQTLRANLGDLLYQNEVMKEKVKTMEQLIEADKISSYNAASRLLEDFVTLLKR